MSSLCDTCRAPGHCCQGFPLTAVKPSVYPTLLEVMVEFAAMHYYGAEGQVQLGLPFVPTHADEQWDFYRFDCVNLLPNGKCGDYANRPWGPCVIYVPGQTFDLCVEATPATVLWGGVLSEKLRAEGPPNG